MSQPSSILFGTDYVNQTIVLYFGTPAIRLILTPEQAEAVAADLIERANTLKQQQRN